MSDPVNLISEWFRELLLGWGLSSTLVQLISFAIGAVVVCLVAMTVVILLIWVERKIAGRIQDRLGPNRAGPFGLLQPFADVIKIMTKEMITPDGADSVPFNLAPVISVAAVLLIWAVIPFAATVVGADIHVGVLYIIAVGSFGIVAILMAGWSSNNKFALLGAARAVAQMVSYEVPMVLALLIPVLLAGSMGINGIVEAQNVWFILLAPIATLVFLITSMAEVGRAPFDLLEAESEIVAGFHTEYSGMKFGMFYVGEFLHVFTIGALIATFFLGGWRGPGAATYPILGFVYFYLKAFLGYFVITWVRLSLPRIRIDHMLAFSWKILTPLILVILMVTAILVKVLENANVWLFTLVMLTANVFIGWAAVQIMKQVEQSKPPQQTFEGRPVAMAPKPPASANS
ncbi:MAG TPA: NADH-quinone oxidoreductase subunit NuoH [Chloroflexi bacterium]|nr:NADH-quinone oxidoreductase subunit NuoH [Chloroflexota bacterium]